MTQQQEGLEIEMIEPIQGHVVVSLNGDLDVGTVDQLKAQPLVAAGRRIVLDMSGVVFCDSAGLGGIVRLLREADAMAASVVLTGPDERLAELLRITGIDRVVPVMASVEEALHGS